MQAGSFGYRFLTLTGKNLIMTFREKKFTLIELIAITLILAIVAVFASAKDSISEEEARVRFAVKLIRADIRFVQSLSLSNDNTNDLYQLNFASGEYTLNRATTSNTNNFPGTDSTTRTIDGITITSNSTTSIKFSTFGVPDTDLTITVTSTSGETASLTIDDVTGSITESL